MPTLRYLNICTVLVIAIVVIWEISFVHASDSRGLTVVIAPRHEECFYERVEKPNQTLIIHYNVIASKGGDFDVNFQVSDASGRPMITEFRKAVSQVNLFVKDMGDYKLCFDNTFSHFSTKTLAFEVTSDNRTRANWETYNRSLLEPEGNYTMQIHEIQEILKRVRVNINQVQVYQDYYRGIEARDRSLSESNFVYVNVCSAINSVLLLLVGFGQVVMMRSFFDNKPLPQVVVDVFKKVYRR